MSRSWKLRKLVILLVSLSSAILVLKYCSIVYRPIRRMVKVKYTESVTNEILKAIGHGSSSSFKILPNVSTVLIQPNPDPCPVLKLQFGI